MIDTDIRRKYYATAIRRHRKLSSKAKRSEKEEKELQSLHHWLFVIRPVTERAGEDPIMGCPDLPAPPRPERIPNPMYIHPVLRKSSFRAGEKVWHPGKVKGGSVVRKKGKLVAVRWDDPALGVTWELPSELARMNPSMLILGNPNGSGRDTWVVFDWKAMTRGEEEYSSREEAGRAAKWLNRRYPRLTRDHLGHPVEGGPMERFSAMSLEESYSAEPLEGAREIFGMPPLPPRPEFGANPRSRRGMPGRDPWGGRLWGYQDMGKIHDRWLKDGFVFTGTRTPRGDREYRHPDGRVRWLNFRTEEVRMEGEEKMRENFGATIEVRKIGPGEYEARRGASVLRLVIHRSGYRDYVGFGNVAPLRRAIERAIRSESGPAGNSGPIAIPSDVEVRRRGGNPLTQGEVDEIRSDEHRIIGYAQKHEQRGDRISAEYARGVAHGMRHVRDLYRGRETKFLMNPQNPAATRRGAPRELGSSWMETKVAPKGRFDPRSFRYKRVPARGKLKAYVLLGCPKGGWHPASQRCEVGTRAHVIMKPGRKAAAAPKRRKVAANPGMGNLPPHIANDPRFQAELRAYKRRHGSGPVEVRKIKVPKGHPKYMSVYGEAGHAVYDAPKHSTKGKRIHHFGKRGKSKPWLVSSVEKGPKFLAYVGGSFRAKPDWIYD